ncbi:flavodoxin family protein [Shewanella submarina]|uniref:Flavodoxin family protein n=1 Tax=Shewanella submarina TaxID=2016376 RepID=A0ABV7GF80_9GAMM|nr:flavodoxin family protein [Shewanella submarina]MCL1039567.1 flavodoxin family protein [Shewanella submarina]
MTEARESKAALRIAIVYFSRTGVTAQMAEAIEQGIETFPQVDVISHQIQGKEIVEGRFANPALFEALAGCDAIIFGSPTYMGSVAAQFKAFADASSDLWCDQLWTDKLAAGFTCGGSPNGDQSSSLHYMATLASQHGMLWLGLDAAAGYRDKGVNRLGCQQGASAHAPEGELHLEDRKTARYLGRRVAEQVLRFSPQSGSDYRALSTG